MSPSITVNLFPFHQDRVSHQWEAHHCGKVAGQKMPRIFLALPAPPPPVLGLQAWIIIYSCTAFFGDTRDCNPCPLVYTESTFTY